MPINKIVFVATDGHLDELARLSIMTAAGKYAELNPKIFLVSLDTQVPDEDPILQSGLRDRIVRVTITEETLKKQFPNVMTKKFLSPTGEMMSHWEHSKLMNQHLAEFSDLAIFSLMKSDPEIDFLYLDSDMITLHPMMAEKCFVAAYDEGENESLYINSSLLYVPKGQEKDKQRWISMMENEILEKYKFRYGMPGPVAFDKFLNRPDSLRGFKIYTLKKDEINAIHYAEMYKSASNAIANKKPLVIDIDHKGPLLNIPRSAVTSALTHLGAEELEVVLAITSNNEPEILTSVKFFPKEVKGIVYYEKLRESLNRAV
jgi:hypothetical protein